METITMQDGEVFHDVVIRLIEKLDARANVELVLPDNIKFELKRSIFHDVINLSKIYKFEVSRYQDLAGKTETFKFTKRGDQNG